jgi:hypothetical protein
VATSAPHWRIAVEFVIAVDIGLAISIGLLQQIRCGTDGDRQVIWVKNG